MPDAVLPLKRLVVLFDRESLKELHCWLPSDTQLTQWIEYTLTCCFPDTVKNAAKAHDLTVEVSVICVSSVQMREMNAQYRGKDSATNVLSFPADMPILPAEDQSDGRTLVLGDIVICPDVLADEAAQQNKLLEHHWAHMVVHSVLHLNGLDHENENAAQAMELQEIQILSKFAITNPYLAGSAKQS